MSEVMDREQQTGTAQAAPEAAPAPEAAEKTSLWKKWKGMPRKKRRKTVRLLSLIHI